MASERPGFFAELRRRNVLRAAALYIAAVWALSQGVAQLSPALGLPDWATRAFLIAPVVGFPLWLGFAWFYEFTPGGFKRESQVAPGESIAHRTGRRLDFAIIGVLAVAVVLLATGYFVRRDAAGTIAATAGPGPFQPPADSIAVLPFTNLSGDPKQRYFSDGITEELTNALGQNTALRVIAWDTASHYRDGRQTPSAIGRALNVANLLNGSIEREGDNVRVLAELVDTRTGTQLWSSHYDDSLANIFAVQDRISAAIAGALKLKFASLGPARPVNPEAHDLVLRAAAIGERGHTAAAFEQARKLDERAIALDPGYAGAHSGLAGATLVLTELSALPLQTALPKVRAEAERALALDPRDVTALQVLAATDADMRDIAGARKQYERALAIDPSNAAAHLNYGTVLPLKEGLPQYLEAVQLDPDDAAAENNLAGAEMDLGQYQQALAPQLALVRLDPASADGVIVLAGIYTLLHRNADAVRAFDLAKPVTELDQALVGAGRLTYRSLLEPKLHDEASAAVVSLLGRKDLDPTSLNDALTLAVALGRHATALDRLPEYCAASPVGCSDLSANPAWLPLHGDPRFEALVKRYDTLSQPAAASS